MTVRQGLVAIVVAGGVLRFVPIWFGLPYMQARPDEETAIGHAAAVLGGDLNPHFFHWPSFTFYALATVFTLASWIRGALSIDPVLTPQSYVLLSRGFVAAAGTLTLVAVFRIGRRTAGNTVGLLAALFLAVSILHVRESHFAMTDVLMTLFVTLSLAMLLRGIDANTSVPSDTAPHVRWFTGAGLMAGLATSTKYSAASVVVAMAVAQLLLLARRDARSVWSPSAWLPAAAFLTAFAVAFVAGTPYAVLDYEHFASDFEFTVSHLAGGHVGDLGRGWIYHLRRSLPYGAGMATFIAAIIGVVPLVGHYRVHALVLGGFAGALYLSIGSGRTVFFRYALPLIPVLCVAAAVGVWHAGRWLASRSRLSQSAAVRLLGAVVAVPAAINCVWFDVLLAKTDTRVLAAEWLVAHSEPSQSLFETPDAYAELDVGSAVHRWQFDMISESFVNAGGRMPDWLVLHESPLWTYARTPPVIRRLAAEKYELAYRVRGTKGAARSAVYDLQDAFFMPVSGLSTVDRPGPTVMIYRRK